MSKNNKLKIFKYMFLLLIISFFDVLMVDAKQIEFHDFNDNITIGICSVAADGTLDDTCGKCVANVCSKWKRWKSQYIPSWGGKYNPDLEGKFWTWTVSKKIKFDIYYCMGGSSNAANEGGRCNACYECIDDSDVRRWSGDGVGDTKCPGGYKIIELSESDCKKKSACYVCKDNANVMKWGVSSSADSLCSSGYNRDESISQSICTTPSACYVCRTDNKEHVMKWSTNGDADSACGDGYVEDSSIAQSDCNTKSVCYVCNSDKNIMKWDKNGDSDDLCSDGYQRIGMMEEHCKPSAVSLDCSKVRTIGEGAQWDSLEPEDNTIECSDDEIQNDLTANYKGCIKTEEIGTSSAPTDNKYYIYVESKVQNNSCTGENGSKIKIDSRYGSKYYVKIAVNTDVLFMQRATFNFGGINESVVRAGKGFTIGPTVYSNSIKWINGNLDDGGNAYYRYSYSEYISGSCTKLDTSFSLKNKDIYYYDYNGEFNKAPDLEFASFSIIAKAAEKYIKTKENSVDNISFVSCDSNDASNCTVVNEEVFGGWDLTNSTTYDITGSMLILDGILINRSALFGREINKSYNYNLADSAIGVSGDNYTKALYANKAKEAFESGTAVKAGNKYYVDLRWVYDKKWPFNLKDNINPSMVDGIDWELSGTCGVNVDDGYYKYGGNGVPDEPTPGIPIPLALSYKYRSISLNNPFPKSDTLGIPINWDGWYTNSINNKNRITYSYDNGVKYMIMISKTGSNDTVKISDINNGTGYTNFVGFDISGTSSFVNSSFTTKQSSGQSYCGLGYFYSDCDKYIN